MKKERGGDWGEIGLSCLQEKKIRSICEKFVIFKIY